MLKCLKNFGFLQSRTRLLPHCGTNDNILSASIVVRKYTSINHSFIFCSTSSQLRSASVPSELCIISALSTTFSKGFASCVQKVDTADKQVAQNTSRDIHRYVSTSPKEVQPPKTSDDEIIYVGTLARMVRFVKLFSLSTSAVGISLQPTIYEHVSQLPLILAAAVGGMAGFFIFLTPVLLHIVTKRYVIEMTLNQKTGEFTATTYSLFLRFKQVKFTPAQVSTPNVPGIFTTVRINNKIPLFIDPNLFTDRRYFIQLMKYDEPLDWEINPEETEEQKKEKQGQLPPKQ